MADQSPLRRAAEQPPCDASAEALALNGMFAVPARMAHYDLGPYLVFVEHRAIWRSMRRAIDGDPDGFWLRTLHDLAREQSLEKSMALLSVLMWSPADIVDDSDAGALVFVLALAKIKRCAEARRRISAAQDEVTRLWRVPETTYSLAEKARLLGHETVGMDIPA